MQETAGASAQVAFYIFEQVSRDEQGEISCEILRCERTDTVPSWRKRFLEVIRGRLKGVVGG